MPAQPEPVEVLADLRACMAELAAKHPLGERHGSPEAFLAELERGAALAREAAATLQARDLSWDTPGHWG